MKKAKELSESALCQEASARTGLTDFGPEVDYFRQSLAVLVDSTLSESRIRDEKAFRELLVHHLCNRLRIQSCLEQVPSILDIPITRPTFVSGLPRAGTTTFSRLIGEDPAIRTLRLWELLSPAPEDIESPSALTEGRIAFAEQNVVARARQGTLDIRPISIFSPDECFYLMRNSFNSDHLHRAVARTPTYFHWMGQRSRHGVYAYYKAQIKLLLWQRPCLPGGHLVLKNPFVHMENMSTIFELFPDAVIVNLTRDVAKVIESLCYKNYADRQAHCDGVRPEDVGADMVENMEVYYRRCTSELNKLGAQQRSRVVTIDYDGWVGDPLSAIRAYYAFLSRRLPETIACRMASSLRKYPRYGRRKRYSLEEFHLRDAELRERFEPHEEIIRRHTTILGAGHP